MLGSVKGLEIILTIQIIIVVSKFSTTDKGSVFSFKISIQCDCDFKG